MKAFYYYILSGLLLPLFCPAQNFRISFQSGYGVYKLADLREFQHLAAEKSAPGVKGTQTFPGWFTYSGSIDYRITGNHAFGLQAGYFTTGARNHLRDYSGEYYLNMLLKGYHAGLHYRYESWNRHNLRLSEQIKCDYIFTRFKMTEQLELGENMIFSEKTSLESHSAGIEPSVELAYTLAGKIGFSLEIGYMLYFESNLHLPGNKDACLYFDQQRKVRLDWSGMRYGAACFLIL